VEKNGTARRVTDNNIMWRIRNAICMPDNQSKNTGTHITPLFHNNGYVVPCSACPVLLVLNWE
jgi:hypothetical protein